MSNDNKFLERDKKEYELNRQWEEDWNLDLNQQVRIDVEQRRILENDYEFERNNVITTRRRHQEEHDRLNNIAKTQNERDKRNNRRKRLKRKARMKVENDEDFFTNEKHQEKSLQRL